MRGLKTLFILNIFIQSILLHPSLGQNNPSQDYLLDDSDYVFDESSLPSDYVTDGSTQSEQFQYYDGVFQPEVSAGDYPDIVAENGGGGPLIQFSPEELPPVFLTSNQGQESEISAENSRGPEITQPAEPRNPPSEAETPQVAAAPVGSMEDLCHVYEGASNIVLDIMESDGATYSQSTSPRHIPHNNASVYYMSKKSWLILRSKLLYEMGQYFSTVSIGAYFT